MKIDGKGEGATTAELKMESKIGKGIGDQPTSPKEKSGTISSLHAKVSATMKAPDLDGKKEEFKTPEAKKEPAIGKAPVTGLEPKAPTPKGIESKGKALEAKTTGALKTGDMKVDGKGEGATTAELKMESKIGKGIGDQPASPKEKAGTITSPHAKGSATMKAPDLDGKREEFKSPEAKKEPAIGKAPVTGLEPKAPTPKGIESKGKALEAKTTGALKTGDMKVDGKGEGATTAELKMESKIGKGIGDQPASPKEKAGTISSPHAKGSATMKAPDLEGKKEEFKTPEAKKEPTIGKAPVTGFEPKAPTPKGIESKGKALITDSSVTPTQGKSKMPSIAELAAALDGVLNSKAKGDASGTLKDANVSKVLKEADMKGTSLTQEIRATESKMALPVAASSSVPKEEASKGKPEAELIKPAAPTRAPANIPQKGKAPESPAALSMKATIPVMDPNSLSQNPIFLEVRGVLEIVKAHGVDGEAVDEQALFRSLLGGRKFRRSRSSLSRTGSGETAPGDQAYKYPAREKSGDLFKDMLREKEPPVPGAKEARRSISLTHKTMSIEKFDPRKAGAKKAEEEKPYVPRKRIDSREEETAARRSSSVRRGSVAKRAALKKTPLEKQPTRSPSGTPRTGEAETEPTLEGKTESKTKGKAEAETAGPTRKSKAEAEKAELKEADKPEQKGSAEAGGEILSLETQKAALKTTEELKEGAKKKALASPKEPSPVGVPVSPGASPKKLSEAETLSKQEGRKGSRAAAKGKAAEAKKKKVSDRRKKEGAAPDLEEEDVKKSTRRRRLTPQWHFGKLPAMSKTEQKYARLLDKLGIRHARSLPLEKDIKKEVDRLGKRRSPRPPEKVGGGLGRGESMPESFDSILTRTLKSLAENVQGVGGLSEKDQIQLIREELKKEAVRRIAAAGAGKKKRVYGGDLSASRGALAEKGLRRVPGSAPENATLVVPSSDTEAFTPITPGPQTLGEKNQRHLHCKL
eukprot:Gregarina_sp_Poly_1__11420@NODE_974_length_5515_cov_36_452827_g488_i1_p1_GENE_NODE_974_length_5515_cov_36_452827_g488_i1NODE_974_length_5515_cov_36_452827_g488_i1_p1_ORF_typecomplete_len1040_score245_22YnfE/PF17452_2/5_3e03YnfE/PF17452_2/13YnfE/PF17452_2/34YnfE/PF17452_2/23RNA_pol_A_bac/PF01000_26/5_2e02RNA_pol_A_bac/PF01000_26/1_6e02RNA_pol_A_bac/PF01000_26/1_6e02RNA_pol_A_bac/PF01000_26/2_2e03_NODE_974_length_5515_cov_36_452827_g488_i123955337